MSMNWADLYGLPSDLSVSVQPTSVSGPTQGSVVPATGKVPPGANAGGASVSFTMTFIGLIILLIAWRLIVGMAK